MVLSTLIQKYFLLVGWEEPVLSIKKFFQSFINSLWQSLKKCWWKEFCLGAPLSAAFLCNFCSCFTWVGIYILNTIQHTYSLHIEYQKSYMKKGKSNICYHNEKSHLSYKFSWSQNPQKCQFVLCCNKFHIGSSHNKMYLFH